MWLLGWVCRWACALCIACSRVMVSYSALYAGSATEASGQVALVYGKAPKTASLGSWDMFSLALSGRVVGLQCMTILILKQFFYASYQVGVSLYSECI
jgi:hypothetical protein